MADNSYVLFNSNLAVDYIKIQKRDDSFSPRTDTYQKYLDAYNNFSEFNESTTLFNTFTDRVEAEYLNPESYTSGTKYSFYRKTPDQQYYDFICELKEGEYKLKDYNIVNDTYYHYLVTAETKTLGTPVITFFENTDAESEDYYVHTNWWKWSLCDIIPTSDERVFCKSGTVWLFAYNLEAGNYTQNTSVTNWDTLGQYGKYSIGQKNYDSSSFSCLLGDMDEFYDYASYKTSACERTSSNRIRRNYRYSEKENILTKEQYDAKMEEMGGNTPEFQAWVKAKLDGNQYSREIEKTNSWKRFISNGNLKLLKDHKGSSWIIQVMPNSQRSVDLKSNYQQTTVSFEWQEAIDVDSVAIISVGD